MAEVFANSSDSGDEDFFDDIEIFDTDWSSHIRKVADVLERLEVNGFTVSPRKWACAVHSRLNGLAIISLFTPRLSTGFRHKHTETGVASGTVLSSRRPRSQRMRPHQDSHSAQTRAHIPFRQPRFRHQYGTRSRTRKRKEKNAPSQASAPE
jgi:hypothetical protein